MRKIFIFFLGFCTLAALIGCQSTTQAVKSAVEGEEVESIDEEGFNFGPNGGD